MPIVATIKRGRGGKRGLILKETKRRRYRKKRVNIHSFRSPVPVKMAATLLYSDQIVLNPAAGTVSKHVFSANGLFDPNVTGVGHQPRGFDQYMALYNHYTVIGAKIRAVAVDDGAGGSNTGTIFGIGVHASPTTLTGLSDYTEFGTTKFKALPSGASQGSSATVWNQVSIPKFMGRKSILSEDDFRGDASANPDEQVYFHVFNSAIDSTDSNNVDVMIQIQYIVVFTEPKDVGSS